MFVKVKISEPYSKPIESDYCWFAHFIPPMILMKVLLAVMLVVVRHFSAGKGAISFSELKLAINLPTRIVNSVLRALVDAEQLLELPSEGKGFDRRFAPAKDIAAFTIYSILEAVEHSGNSSIDLDSSRELREVSDELERIKDEVRSSQQNTKLVDIKTDPKE